MFKKPRGNKLRINERERFKIICKAQNLIRSIFLGENDKISNKLRKIDKKLSEILNGEFETLLFENCKTYEEHQKNE